VWSGGVGEVGWECAVVGAWVELGGVEFGDESGDAGVEAAWDAQEAVVLVGDLGVDWEGEFVRDVVGEAGAGLFVVAVVFVVVEGVDVDALAAVEDPDGCELEEVVEGVFEFEAVGDGCVDVVVGVVVGVVGDGWLDGGFAGDVAVGADVGGAAGVVRVGESFEGDVFGVDVEGEEPEAGLVGETVVGGLGGWFSRVDDARVCEGISIGGAVSERIVVCRMGEKRCKFSAGGPSRSPSTNELSRPSVMFDRGERKPVGQSSCEFFRPGWTDPLRDTVRVGREFGGVEFPWLLPNLVN
jgi:hypothetical protein